MIKILPALLSNNDIKRIMSSADKFSRMMPSSHHSDEGHISGKFRATKPYLMVWLAAMIEEQIKHLHLGSVDAQMQIYRLSSGEKSAVPLHTDEDFSGPKETVARYSLLIKLNDEYTGGETRFDFGWTKTTPNIMVGSGILFSHDMPHEGLPVLSGEKLVLKTDIFA